MNDFELRFVLRRVDDRDARILQFRRQIVTVNGQTGAYNMAWTEWTDVPLVIEAST